MSKDDVHEIDVDKDGKDGKDGDWNVVDSSSIPKEDETEISRRSRSTYVFIFSTCEFTLHINKLAQIYILQSLFT